MSTTNPDSIEETLAFRPRYDAAGLIPAVVTRHGDRAPLMVAYMNAEAVRRTIETGEAWFWSRSRGTLWRKGDTSGQVLTVREMRVDCDQDCLWLSVEVGGDGGCCHTGRDSCFYRVVATGEGATGAHLRRED